MVQTPDLKYFEKKHHSKVKKFSLTASASERLIRKLQAKMYVTGPSLPPCLFLLLCLLTLGHAENESTTGPSSAFTSGTPDPNITDTSSMTTNATEGEQNMTRADCLVDNQMGLIAIGSALGLILCLLVTVVILACQVHHLQRRVYIPRSSRSNLDLAGSAGHWGNADTSTGREGGLVGPCDNSVMLEEVKTQEEEEMEVLGEITEERDEDEEEEGATGSGLSPEEKPLMQRESSSDLPQDLEDMPLVV